MPAGKFLEHSSSLTQCVIRALADGHGRETLPDRAAWLHKWCKYTLPKVGVSVTSTGPVPDRGLLVSNHLSYLDIMVYSAITPCVFVSKKEVKSWPVFGALATRAGTVYIDRERTADAHRVRNEVADALRGGMLVVVYPEGTSSDGRSVLPFKPALFQAAIEAETEIIPAHLRYSIEDGDPGQDIAYWGDMTFFPHLLKLLGKRRIDAHVTFAEKSIRAPNRRDACELAYAAVTALAGIATANLHTVQV
jgi:1-acyl-sn-glycerol-3-phosphate acyltransferase